MLLQQQQHQWVRKKAVNCCSWNLDWPVGESGGARQNTYSIREIKTWLEWFLFCSFHFFSCYYTRFYYLFKASGRSSLTLFPIFVNRFDARAGIIEVRSSCYWKPDRRQCRERKNVVYKTEDIATLLTNYVILFFSLNRLLDRFFWSVGSPLNSLSNEFKPQKSYNSSTKYEFSLTTK